MELVALTAGSWTVPLDDPDGHETVAVIERVAADPVGEDDVTVWIAARRV